MSPNKKMIEILKRYGSFELSLEHVKDIIDELSLIYFVEEIQDEYIVNRINFYMDIQNIIEENMIYNGYKKVKIK